MRRSQARLVASAAVSLTAGWCVLLAFLAIGGVVYRRDCPAPMNQIMSDWVATLPPVPFVFRPAAYECEVHSGARVVLATFGIAEFE